MANIFISYRREDSADVTGRIRDRLVKHFGKEAVFIDVDNIPLGVNFADHLDSRVGQCEVLLAIIGRDWLTVTNRKGERRLDVPEDFVRIELKSALNREIPVVPLLVRGASMPAKSDLPESIRELALRNGMPVRSDPDFHNDCDRLIEGLDKHLAGDAPIEAKESADSRDDPPPLPVELDGPPDSDLSATPPEPRITLKRVLGAAAILGALILGYVLWPSASPEQTVTIDQFRVTPQSISEGERATVSWRTRHAERVNIEPLIGAVAGTGSKTITPESDTTYSISAADAEGRSVQAQASIEVVRRVTSGPEPARPTAQLSASPQSIERGQRTKLSWQTSNATEVEVSPEVGRSPAIGSKIVIPDQDTTYKLTAKGEGGLATDSVLVRVREPEPTSSTGDRVAAFRRAESRQGRLQFHANFENETAGAPPRSPNTGRWVTLDTDAGKIVVDDGVGDMRGKSVHLQQRNGVAGGVNLKGQLNGSGTSGVYFVTWRALVSKPSPCFATVAVRHGDPVASIAYRPNGRITTGANSNGMPIEWKLGVWQLFEIEVDLDSRHVSYRIDGEAMQGFQRLPIASASPVISTISMELGCMQSQSFAWDDVRVVRTE